MPREWHVPKWDKTVLVELGKTATGTPAILVFGSGRVRPNVQVLLYSTLITPATLTTVLEFAPPELADRLQQMIQELQEENDV